MSSRAGVRCFFFFILFSYSSLPPFLNASYKFLFELPPWLLVQHVWKTVFSREHSTDSFILWINKNYCIRLFYYSELLNFPKKNHGFSVGFSAGEVCIFDSGYWCSLTSYGFLRLTPILIFKSLKIRQWPIVIFCDQDAHWLGHFTGET